MEVEFRLPLGKLLGSASTPTPISSRNGNGNGNNILINNGNGNGKGKRNDEPPTTTTTRVNVNVGSSVNNKQSLPANNGNGTRILVNSVQPGGGGVKTTVNHNGTIETHFDCSDESKSSVEIEVGGREPNVFLVNGKSVMTSCNNNNEPKTYRKISDIGLYRNRNGTSPCPYPPVRVTDICKDSDEEFM
jgi:hypothetical protein